MCLRLLFYIILAANLFFLFPRDAISQEPLGRFPRQAVVRMEIDGLNMTLLEPFEFIDPKGRNWTAPAGTKIDGASIPRPFWSLIGGPFEGRYRDASVIHDYYCFVRSRTAADTHKAFYDGMLANGVAAKKAWLMYRAVVQFGPQWPPPKLPPECENTSNPDYNFERCARASARPPVEMKVVSRDTLVRFIEEVREGADPEDVRKLQSELGRLQ